jgi:hypothetical protein
MSWTDFIRAHMSVLVGIDFFTAEVLTWRGLATYYVQSSLHSETRRVMLAGITQCPTEEWMVQMARQAVDAMDGTFFNPFCSARARQQVLRFLSKHPALGRYSTSQTASPQSQSECVCRTLGMFNQRRVSIEADPLRGSVFTPGSHSIHRPLSPRTASLGQRQSAALPFP